MRHGHAVGRRSPRFSRRGTGAACVKRYMVDLLELWPVLLFWPAVALSLLVASVGLTRSSPTPLLVAAALVCPASAYLAATPRFFLWGLSPVVVYLAAAVATRREPQEAGHGSGCSEWGDFWVAGSRGIRLSPVRRGLLRSGRFPFR